MAEKGKAQKEFWVRSETVRTEPTKNGQKKNTEKKITMLES